MSAFSADAFDQCRTASAKVLYAMCPAFADPDGWLPSPRKLGRRIRLSERTISRAQRELILNGILERLEPSAPLHEG